MHSPEENREQPRNISWQIISRNAGEGGGSQEKWSSQIAHISVWNGGFKIGKLCGCVCTQKGGQNERFTHKSQMYTPTVELCVEWYLFL